MNYPAQRQDAERVCEENEPVIFLKPDSALLKDGKPFFIPDFSNEVQYEAELVVRISRLGKNIAPRFASRYYDAVTVGIDFTACDMLRRAQQQGHPWELSKGFDASAVVGDFVPVGQFPDVSALNFSLSVDDQEVQRGCASDMRFAVDELIAYVSRFMTLKIGDLLFTGAPSGALPASIGQHLQGCLEGEKVLDFYIR